MPQTLTLHIGLPKTGTTSLQSNLFARHSQLTYAGKPKVHHDPAQLRLLRPIVEHPPEQFDANFERYRQEEVIPFLEAAGDRVLISEEEFSTGTHLIRVHRDVIAERLHRLFPQAQVLMTVRSQLRVLESLYCHLLNVGFMDEIPFGTWIDLEIERPDEEGRLQFLGYDRLLARYRGLFGPDQVHVHIFEHFRRDPDAFIRSLCRLLEIDADEALELQNAHAKLNTRATLRQMRWQAWNRRNPGSPWPHRIQRFRLARLWALCLSKGPAVDTRYTPAQTEHLERYYGASNVHLSEMLGEDLGALGYAT